MRMTLEQYVILDVFGSYFFWPDWTEELLNRLNSLPTGRQATQELLAFTWPEGEYGEVTDLYFWAGFLAPGTTTVVGDISWATFGFR